MAELKAIDDFHEYTLHEQLQTLVDMELQVWLPAREFLQQVFKMTFYSPASGIVHLAETKHLFTQMVVDMLEAAMDAGEIPEQPYQELLPRLFWDYQSGVLAYWLKDDSEGFANTTQLVDSSMGIIASILNQGLVGKSLDLLSFLFRTHVMTHFDALTEHRAVAKAVKRGFMRDSEPVTRKKGKKSKKEKQS